MPRPGMRVDGDALREVSDKVREHFTKADFKSHLRRAQLYPDGTLELTLRVEGPYIAEAMPVMMIQGQVLNVNLTPGWRDG